VARDAIEDAIDRERGDPVARVATPLFFRGRADWVAVYSRDLSEVGEIVDRVEDAARRSPARVPGVDTTRARALRRVMRRRRAAGAQPLAADRPRRALLRPGQPLFPGCARDGPGPQAK
jgi:hypothetical protein